MPESLQAAVAIAVLVAVFVLSRYIIAYKIRRASMFIINDMKRRGALDSYSAVEAPYARRNWFRIGLRDYRPQAMESLLAAGAVVRTPEGKYYLGSAVTGDTE